MPRVNLKREEKEKEKEEKDKKEEKQAAAMLLSFLRIEYYDSLTARRNSFQ